MYNTTKLRGFSIPETPDRAMRILLTMTVLCIRSELTTPYLISGLRVGGIGPAICRIHGAITQTETAPRAIKRDYTRIMPCT